MCNIYPRVPHVSDPKLTKTLVQWKYDGYYKRPDSRQYSKVNFYIARAGERTWVRDGDTIKTGVQADRKSLRCRNVVKNEYFVSFLNVKL